MYYLDENMVQVWKECDKDIILLLNHTWRSKQEIERSGFKLYFAEVSTEQLAVLQSLKTITNERDYIQCVKKIGLRFFEKLVKYKYLTEESTVCNNKSVWHSQVGEYLPKYLEGRYGIEYPERPSRVLLLPTLRCGGNCIFCITNSNNKAGSKELNIEEWQNITVRVCNELQPCSVDIVGGEPMIRPVETLQIAKILTEHNILVKLITNGIAFSNEDIVEEFAAIFREKKHNIQISLDGDKETHNYIRPGVDYELVLKAISNLSKCELTFGVNLTVNKLNLNKIEMVIRKIAKYHPAYIMLGPLQVSPKNIRLCQSIMLSEEEESTLHYLVRQLKKEFFDIIIKFDKEEPIYSSNVQPLGNGKKLHRCTGFIEEMTIHPAGKIVSCLRGTAYEELYGESIINYPNNLKLLWKNNEQAKQFRNIPVRKKCAKCEYNQQCNLGCPIEAYILEGVLGGYNPYCNYLNDKEGN